MDSMVLKVYNVPQVGNERMGYVRVTQNTIPYLE